MTKGVPDSQPFLLGSWQVHPGLNRIVSGSEVRKLRPQVMDLLTFLVQRRGKLVTSDEMHESIWAGKVVSSATVYSTVAQLRRALAGVHDVNLETIPRRGYRLLAPRPEPLPEPVEHAGVEPADPTGSERAKAERAAGSDRFAYPGRARVIVGIAILAGLIWMGLRLTTDAPEMAESTVLEPALPAGDPVPIVAVLPFRNLATNEENAVIAAGVHEEILTQLSRLPDVDVISRTSVMRYSGNVPSLPEVAKALGATHIVEGSVQRSGERLRVTAQLINASTDTHLWANTYDRELQDVFGVQTEVAIHVADALGSTFSPESALSSAGGETDSLEAYELFLKARQLGNRYFDDEVRRQQTEYLREALAIDPDYADAWRFLVQLEVWMVHIDADPDGEHLLSAENALRQAQRLAPESTDTMLAEGWFLYQGKKQFGAALNRVNAARALEPRRGDLIQLQGFIVNRMGRREESLELLAQASRLDPLNAQRASFLGWRLVHIGRYQQGLKAYLRAYRASATPGPWAKYSVEMARVLVAPDYREWQRLHDDLVQAHEGDPSGLPYGQLSYQFIEHLFLTGQRETAWKFLDRPGGNVDSENHRGVHSGFWEVEALSFRGEEQAARELAERVLDTSIEMARRPDLGQMYRDLSALHKARLGPMLGREDVARDGLAYIRQEASGYYMEAIVVSNPEEAQHLYLEGEEFFPLHHLATRPHIWYPLLDHPEVRARFDDKQEWVQFMRDRWPESREFPFD